MVTNAERGAGTDIGENVGVLRRQFGAERRASDLHQRFAIGLDRYFGLFENLQRLLLRQFETFGNDARMKTLAAQP